MHIAFVATLFIGQLAQEPDAPVPAREAAARMTVPDGFKVTLFAGEPDVKQPIAFTFDDRGRLWVVECYSYPKWHADPKQGKDRVLIFEDTDGDGQFDKRTVFAENLSNLSGIEYGFGGIWLCSLPNLIFIPIKDDKPAGPPEIKLDGWDMKCGHNVFNGLKWGPDGWLYGLNGILSNSKVGPPGTPEKDRVFLNCGVWRYHPTRKKFEAYAHGTTNPWGLDWNEHGEMFITNCVIGHLWHVVPGAHFERMFGQDVNPHAYGLLKSCADHIHWGGGSWTSSRGGQGVHSEAGGGHAHVGCMIYQGDNWPQRYRGGVFMCNLHGGRINHDILERNGSSYVARHGKDFLFANDPWFRGLALDYGPDGGVYLADWTDTGECHNYKVAHTASGRIYKIIYEDKASGGRKPAGKVDLAKLSDEELVKLQTHPNHWFVRHARRILQERRHAGSLGKNTREHILDDVPVTHRLQQVSALHVVEGIDEELYLKLSRDDSEWVRSFLVRTSSERLISDALERRLREMALQDPSPVVQLSIASLLQRLPTSNRMNVGLDFLLKRDYSADPYLPWMVWYANEPNVAEHPKFVLALTNLVGIPTPLHRELIARRVTDREALGYQMILDASLGRTSPAYQRDLLRGLVQALKGRRGLEPPKSWEKGFSLLVESPLEEVRQLSLLLGMQMRDERARKRLESISSDATQSQNSREHALRVLLMEPTKDLARQLHRYLDDPMLRRAAITGLANVEDPQTPALLLDRFGNFSADEQSSALETLSTRPPYALALLDAVASKRISRADLSQATLRQLLALNSKEVTAKVEQVWGSLRPSSAEKTQLIAKYKALLTGATLKKADKGHGRALFAKTCAQCHRLFGEGGEIGPDITGAQRNNLDYILENIVDPSAVVQREFLVSVVTTSSGRTITGIVKQETNRALTLQTQNEVLVLPKDDIEAVQQTRMSMMPDGLLDNLRLEDVRDLIGYLASPVQVPTK